jgi:hypothetical protein
LRNDKNALLVTSVCFIQPYFSNNVGNDLHNNVKKKKTDCLAIAYGVGYHLQFPILKSRLSVKTSGIIV